VVDIIKRPLLLFSISLGTGILSAYLSKSYLFVAISVFVLLISISIFYAGIKTMAVLAAVSLLFYCIGAFEYLYVENMNMSKFMNYAGKEVEIYGYIDSEPDIKANRVSYIIKTSEISDSGESKAVEGRILFTTLNDNSGNIFEYGRKMKITGILNLPSGRRNPGGFDFRQYLAKSGISATVFATPGNINPGTLQQSGLFGRTGLFLRKKIVDIINRSLPEEQAGLMNGMLIGYREGMTKSVQQAFSDAGLSHLMAVSGMNVAFIVFPLAFVFRKLQIGKKISNSFIICVLLLFIYITGFSPSVLRAVIMGIILLAGEMIYREPDVYTSISFAAIILLLYNPYNLFDIGFQLSFAATFSLVLLYKNFKEFINFKFMPDIAADVLAATMAAQVGVLPIVVYYFNKISLVSVFSNLLVVPLVQVITIFGALMVLLGGINIIFSQLLGYINCTFLSFVLFVTKISASLPMSVIKVVTPSIPVILSYYAAAIFFLWYKPLYRIKIAAEHYMAALAIIAAIICIKIIIPMDMEVVFIDVGEGDSTFIRTHTGKTVLIDGGGYSSKIRPDSNIGESVIIPFLLDYEVTRLDLAIGTHGHDDHLQGLTEVIKGFDVGSVIIPDVEDKRGFTGLLKASGDKGIPVNTCGRGDSIKLDNYTSLDVLHPGKGYIPLKSTLNNSSLVLKLCYKNTSILFPGDIEEEAEKVLLSYRQNLAADVIKVAHHGSSYSTGVEFLSEVKPEAAVISVGKNNFGHPSPGVLERLKGNNIRLLRTDLDGAVILTSNGDKINIRSTLHK